MTHVTNGVHEPTWLGAGDARAARPPPRRGLAAARRATRRRGRRSTRIPDEELWAARRAQRAALVDWVRERTVLERLSRGDAREYVEAAARAFDPDVLTIGFARRVATYKRLHLLLQDRDRSLAALADGRPVQLLIAGKAHPRDDDGKRLVQHLFTAKDSPAVAARVAFLEDYDLALAARLVQGCDVWLNLPRPPLEASGTSGMKNAVNGGLHLSVLDGWWAEGYTGDNGWPLSGEVDGDHGAQDHRDARRARAAARRRGRPRLLRPRRGRPAPRLAGARQGVAADARAAVQRRADAGRLRAPALRRARADALSGRGDGPGSGVGRIPSPSVLSA